MSDPASNPPKQYFVGVNGERKGPYAETVLTGMISSKEIPEDSLVWCEGMSDWKSLKEIPELSTPLAKTHNLQSNSVPSPPTKKPEPLPQKTIVSHSSPVFDRDFSPQTIEVLEPVFGDGRIGGGGASFAKQRILFILLGLIALACVGGVAFYWWAENSNQLEATKLVKPKQSKEAQRQLQYSEALTKMSTEPDSGIAGLRELFKSDPKDKIGKDALEAVIEYYRRQQKPVEVGKALLEAKRPKEAVKFFLEEPTAIREAEAALTEAVNASEGTEKKDFLIKQIKLLLGPLDDFTKSVERIRFFEKSFPGENHPYSYYLKSTDERIADIFSRISFHFISSLYSFLTTELPQINLVERPLIEVTKNKSGEYRIVGTYKGQVLLNQDRLPSIFFTFWLANEQWYVIDTNLTKERSTYGAGEREKHKSDVLSGNEMLKYLELVFKTQFPKNALHEVVSPEKNKASNTIE